jgi:hypothetical protein
MIENPSVLFSCNDAFCRSLDNNSLVLTEGVIIRSCFGSPCKRTRFRKRWNWFKIIPLVRSHAYQVAFIKGLSIGRVHNVSVPLGVELDCARIHSVFSRHFLM